MSSELRALWESAGGKVPGDWAVVPLESLLRDNKSIAVGVMYPGEHTPGGVPLIKVGDIKGGSIPVRPDYYISAETNHEYRRTQLSGDELLITLVGNPGECVVVKPEMAGWNPARAIASVKLKDVGLRTYLKAVLESSAGKHLIDAVLNTTVQKTLNLKDIRRLPIPIPDKEAIATISNMSEALTDRITLLRETNATLEAIAQTLFKSWFVNFDPVRAKMEGRAPEGIDEATAAMFPDALEETESRYVPKGWPILRIEEVAERVGMGPFGSNIKVETFVEAGIPVLNGANVQGALLEDVKFRFVTEEHGARLRNSSVHAGDIVLTHRGTLGQVSLVPRESKYSEYVLSQSQFFLRCAPSIMEPEWMLYFLRSPSGKHLLLANASQVGVPSIARPSSYLRSMRLVVPPIGIVSRFADVTRSLHSAIVGNREKIQVLVTLRDTLLPRLISGQLRLSGIETNPEVIAV